MNDGTHEVRELLGRAVERVTGPSTDPAAVFGAASRIRRRRRAVVGGTGLALVAAAVIAGPGLASGGTERAVTATAPTQLTAGTGREEKLAALLPSGIGKVEEVSWPVLIKGADPAADADARTGGPLDGEYAVRRDGGVGFLHISVRSAKDVAGKHLGGDPAADLCAPDADTGDRRADCVREELPDGGVLTIWRQPARHDEGTPVWGEELTGRLLLPDGRALLVRDSTGYDGDGRLGPLLSSPPLTRDQLRTLMLRPVLVAG
ncbi:hypothetical protein QWJ26_25920 [Streptomyces sp. CSDS2]|uniref:hypothetical protein n=1 Tax=Streptomyces sp. CSDS2 TaxID=3055051 RepID=UPI0025B06250|nr:hypothetical protein [Streptomyces sp. CSDS2]MDN3263191.1 hypothetical protein [Streptomyces sp. CSDS2]